MSTDGNLAALRQYEQEQERLEKIEASFDEEVDNTVGPLLMEAIETFKALVEKYSIDKTFEQYVEEF